MYPKALGNPETCECAFTRQRWAAELQWWWCSTAYWRTATGCWWRAFTCTAFWLSLSWLRETTWASTWASAGVRSSPLLHLELINRELPHLACPNRAWQMVYASYHMLSLFLPQVPLWYLSCPGWLWSTCTRMKSKFWIFVGWVFVSNMSVHFCQYNIIIQSNLQMKIKGSFF